MKPDFTEAAKKHSELMYHHSYTGKICGAADFIAGAEHGYSKAMKWISVKDRLPDEHINVLVFLESESQLLGVMDSNDQWYVFWRDGLNYEDPDRLVTHWMNLPEPPQI